MKTEWREVALGSVADVVGGATPDTSVLEYFGGDIPWITPKDLSGYGFRRISRGERTLTPQGLDSCGTKLMPAGTVLLTSRAPIGYVAIAENPVCTNQGFKSLVLKPNQDPEFYYYLLKHNTETLERHATGSTFKEISTSIVRSIKFRVPDYTEQKRIAGILGTLDDKIELNHKMNETLEQIARALFKSWFIDFEPVHSKAAGRQLVGMDKATAGLFPESFEDSKMGKIPKGWKIEKLSTIMTFQGGSQPPAREFISENREGYVRLVQIRDFYTDSHATYVPESTKLRKFSEDDLMLARYGSSGNAEKGTDSLGRMCRGLSGAYNVALVKVVPLRPLREFLFYFLKSDSFLGIIKSMGARSVQSGFRKEDLDVIYTVTAPPIVHEAFESLAQDIWRKIFKNNQQSRTLSKLRDSLLEKFLDE